MVWVNGRCTHGDGATTASDGYWSRPGAPGALRGRCGLTWCTWAGTKMWLNRVHMGRNEGVAYQTARRQELWTTKRLVCKGQKQAGSKEASVPPANMQARCGYGTSWSTVVRCTAVRDAGCRAPYTHRQSWAWAGSCRALPRTCAEPGGGHGVDWTLVWWRNCMSRGLRVLQARVHAATAPHARTEAWRPATAPHAPTCWARRRWPVPQLLASKTEARSRHIHDGLC